MGKRARNRRRARRAQPWEGIDGRNPLTLAPEAFDSHVPQAYEHIVAVGFSDDGRPSLAGCWVMGERLIAAAVDAEVAPGWVGEAHPLVVAYLGATADPQVASLPLKALTAAADAWAEALDAAGANDRLRAFTDAADRLARHDNPHGHALNQALAVELAGRPLTLEPLARRLLPAAVVATDPGAADAAYPPGPRRTTTTSSTRISLSGEEGETVVDALRRAFHDAARLGLGPDASLGDIMQSQGVDPDEAEQEMLAMVEAFDPAAAYAWLATDGLLLTEDNIRLVDPVDARRWQEAGGPYQAVFAHADQLFDADPDEDAWFDARTEAGGIALDELGACIDDGAMKAWDHLVDRIEAHPAADAVFAGMDFGAFTELDAAADAESEQAALEAARRLAAARFDAAVVEAFDRVARAAGGIPEGDVVVHEQAPDRRQRLAVWTVLLAGIRATSGEVG